MDRATTLTLLESNAHRFMSIVSDPNVDVTAPVPSCPDWTLNDLADHLGRLYGWVAAILDNDPDGPPTHEMVRRRDQDVASAEWVAANFGDLRDRLDRIPEEELRWNFIAKTRAPVAFWWRRQLHETAIHRVDAELSAAHPPSDLAPEAAVDGIDEVLEMLAMKEIAWDEIQLGDSLSLHLHATDVEGAEWTIDTGRAAFARAHLKSDVALRGPSWALDRWLWTRLPGDPGDQGLEIFGDATAAEAWRPHY